MVSYCSLYLSFPEILNWRAVIHGVAKSQTRLSNWTELNWTEDIEHLFICLFNIHMPSLVGYPGGSAEIIHLPRQQIQIRSLGQKDPLEEEVANPLQYSCLENPTDRGAWGLQSMGLHSQTWLKQLSIQHKLGIHKHIFWQPGIKFFLV